MRHLNKIQKNRIIFLLTIGLFLFIIGVGIHKKAYQAVAPPIYDPISYYWKSKIVWNAIQQHDWKSAFNQFPSRPPGIALILYPFGFVPSIQSFLFRSTIAPILLWALALTLIILPKVRDLKEAIVGGALSVGLLALPIFYHFEIPSDTERPFGISIQWGLVDVLQASLGAVALALIYTGIRKKIRLLILFAWFVGGYTFFIKPSGILILLNLLIVFNTETFILFQKDTKEWIHELIWFVIFIFIGIGTTAFSVCMAFFGGYLSRDIIKTAQGASKILIQIEHQPILSQLKLMVWPVFGPCLFLPIAATTLVSLYIFFDSIIKRRFSDLGLRAAASATIFSATLYWWITMAGEEHRYLFPFIMLIVSWLIVPTLFEWMIILGSRMRYTVMAYCLIPLICLLTLLNIQEGKINSKIEKFLGYNLDAAQYRDEVKMGRSLLQEAVRLNKTLNIYSIGNNHVGVVEMISLVNSIENKSEVNHFVIYRINDWKSPGIKIKQLLSCDYIIIQKSNLKSSCSEKPDVMRWHDEEPILTKFLSTTANNSESGIKLIQEGPVFLYKVESREKFLKLANQWVNTHKWSDDFWVRNSYERGDFAMP
jgi:hypothetical protein